MGDMCRRCICFGSVSEILDSRDLLPRTPRELPSPYRAPYPMNWEKEPHGMGFTRRVGNVHSRQWDSLRLLQMEDSYMHVITNNSSTAHVLSIVVPKSSGLSIFNLAFPKPRRLSDLQAGSTGSLQSWGPPELESSCFHCQVCTVFCSIKRSECSNIAVWLSPAALYCPEL